jgi:hypothetical protein
MNRQDAKAAKGIEGCITSWLLQQESRVAQAWQ